MNHRYKAMKSIQSQKEKVHERMKLKMGVKKIEVMYYRNDMLLSKKQSFSRLFGPFWMVQNGFWC